MTEAERIITHMRHNFDMETVLSHLRTSKKKNLILDTDTFNEIDDQFAITYAMLADDIRLLALTAAPFFNIRVSSVTEGMEKSYDEMKRIRDLIDPAGKRDIPCYHGAADYLKNTITPQVSEAAENIVRLVHEADDIVYIAMLGCYTNVASALLMDPSIMEKAVVIMVGANKFERGDCNEFNLRQDRAAARVIFECGVPLVVLPAFDGTERLYMTTGELLYYFRGRAGAVGDYLCDIFVANEQPAEDAAGNCTSRQRSIWDIAAVAFLRQPDEMTRTSIVPARTVDAKGYWRDLNDGRNMLYAESFQRSRVLSDFYTVVRRAALTGDID